METKNMDTDTNDLMIEIAIGGTDRGRAVNRKMTWSDFTDMLAKPRVDGRYTVEAYQALDGDAKAAAKKTGFFAGGPSEDGKRNRDSIVARSILTLDIDHITDPALAAGIRDRRIGGLEGAACVYTTRSHTHDNPRIRIVMPLSRMVDEQEYSAISRLMAQRIDPELCQTDPASSRIAQIMYLPSISSDQEYIHFAQPGGPIDVDALLEGVDLSGASDGADLPRYAGERRARMSVGGQLGDPRRKSGIVGAFCRAYSIESALGRFLPGVYLPTAEAGRLTFAGGSSTAGAKIFDLHLHSWHGTDPCGGLSVNAYDMVRIHLFGDCDADAPEDMPFHALPSQRAMRDMAMADPAVVAELDPADRPVVADDFAVDKGPVVAAAEDEIGAWMDGGPLEPTKSADDGLDGFEELAGALGMDDVVGEPETPADISAHANAAAATMPVDDADEEEDPEAWKEALDWETVRSTREVRLRAGSYNVGVILRSDPRIRDAIAYDELRDRSTIVKPLNLDFPGSTPFAVDKRGSELTDTMISVIWAWMQAPAQMGGFGFKPTRAEIEAAIDITASRNKFHPIQDMITDVVWDGEKRLETYLHRYLGCDDNAYTREVGRLLLLGMITRAFEPGAKFDFVPVLEGAEGLGKSTFVRALSGDFYASVAKGDMRETKRMLDKINAAWVVEMPELAVFEGEDPKQLAALITETDDQERLAYGRHSLRYKRGNIFVGTTNERQYLTKRTGNRRFLPIAMRKQVDIAALTAELPQLYAEAYSSYKEMRAATRIGKSGREELLYPRDLPLYLEPGSDAAKIALSMQLSRLVEHTEDSVLGAAIGALTTPLEELTRSSSVEPAVFERMKTVDILSVDEAGKVKAQTTYLAEIPIWFLHDLIFPDVEYHARQSPLTKAIPAAPWARKGRTARTGSQKYGQQVLYAIDVSELFNQVLISVGDEERCEGGVRGPIKGIQAYKAAQKQQQKEERNEE